jgi:predicted glycoside hydrolase/deacetylase ChbG (UPF0249 family)
LIINADDFGLSSLVNTAIISCFEKGIINSTSLMTNTPGFLEAVELAKEKNYTDRIGVHINLTQGKPLTNFKFSKYLNEDGTWDQSSFSNREIWLNKEIKNGFLEEIAAQINIVKKVGIIPSHINSHHHIHTFPALFFLFLKICRAYSYKLRVAQTHSNRNIVKSGYRKYINSRIKKTGLQFSDYFETIESYNKRKQNIKKGIVEIMVHPSYNDKGVLIDALKSENVGQEYIEFYNRFD